MATLTNLTINDTGFLRLPSGATGDRPGSPVAGMIRYNTTIAANEFYNGTAWIPVAEPTVGTASTGGTITNAAGYRIHTYTSGSSTFVPARNGVVDVLVIGGGGSGSGLGGGGGAGGYIYVQGVPVIGGTSYPTVVGAGAAAVGATHGPNGNEGNPSTFGGGTPVGITASKGGAGTGYYVPGPAAVNDGGSGGGGSGYSYASETFRPAGSGTTGQGHPGGYGSHYNGTPEGTHYGGGGGGGAGTQGYNRGGRYGQARGGEGQASSISGTTVWRGAGGAGGAHNVNVPHGAASLGGKGGGGPSGIGNADGQSGVTNTGSGGGAANHPDGGSGTGGPGIVIVRYRG